jgi:hypothetical protein
VVLYTLKEEDLVSRLEQTCRELGLPCLSILGPVLQLFQSYLGSEKSHRVGAQHVLNAEYFKRIDALNFTMLHDDGQNAEGLEGADVVLGGVSLFGGRGSIIGAIFGAMLVAKIKPNILKALFGLLFLYVSLKYILIYFGIQI